MSTEVHKITIAIEYLETAATLCKYELNHFSAIHLAAAAEEISGKACRIAGERSNFDELRDKVQSTLLALKIDFTEKDLRDVFYDVKNSIKHMDSRTDAMVNIDLKQELIHYILSAYRNFEKLGLQDNLSEIVKKVVDNNTIHIEVDAQ